MKIKINEQLIKQKFYSTYYFQRTHDLLKKYNANKISTLQFVSFQKEPYMLCGVDEVILIIKKFLNPQQLKKIELKARKDGDIILPNEPALTIKGPYYLFCELENIIDAVLARRSSIATNCWKILQYIKPSQLIYMSDRSDDYTLHPYDGYAAYVAGVRKFSNDSHIAFIEDTKVKVYGSMPHALIHQYENDMNALLNDYLKLHKDVSLLVDFNNDIIGTLKSINQKYYNKISSIRIDTSKKIIDKSLKQYKHNQKYYGVNKYLIKLVRQWLDQNNLKHIKIVATSENNLERIKDFIKNQTPIDFYGIGSYLTHLSIHFTADLVTLNNKSYAKKGRKKLNDQKLKKINLI